MSKKNVPAVETPATLTSPAFFSKEKLPFGIPEPVVLGILLVLSIAAVVVMCMTPLTTNDFWLQMKIGNMIVDNFEIPATAMFEYTDAKDMRFVAHEWVPSILFYLIFSAVGYLGFIFVKGMFGVVIFALACLLSYQVNRNKLLSLFIGVLSVMIMNFRHYIRPEIFAYMTILIHLNCIIRYRQTLNKNWLIALVPLALFWVNSHGSYLTGWMFLPVFAGGDFIDNFIRSIRDKQRFDVKAELAKALPYIYTVAAIIAISFLNPYGYELFVHSFTLADTAFIKQSVYEWVWTFSKTFRVSRAFDMYMAYLAIYAICIIIGFRQLRTSTIVLALAFAYLSQDAQRHIAVFGLVTALVLATLLINQLTKPKSQLIFASVFAVFLLVLTFQVKNKGNFMASRMEFRFSTRFTEKAIKFIHDNKLEGNVINSYPLGAQIIYNFYPKLKVAMDSRIDIYGERYWNRYKMLFRDEKYLLKWIDRYNVRYFILTPHDFNAAFARRKGLAQTGWKFLYRDPKIIILSRH